MSKVKEIKSLDQLTKSDGRKQPTFGKSQFLGLTGGVAAGIYFNSVGNETRELWYSLVDNWSPETVQNVGEYFQAAAREGIGWTAQIGVHVLATAATMSGFSNLIKRVDYKTLRENYQELPEKEARK